MNRRKVKAAKRYVVGLFTAANAQHEKDGWMIYTGNPYVSTIGRHQRTQWLAWLSAQAAYQNSWVTADLAREISPGK